MDQYTFSEKLQVKLLSLLRSGYISPTDIQPDFFEHPVLSSVCKSLQSMNGTAKHVTSDILIHQVKKDLGSSSREFQEDIEKFIKYTCRDLPETQIDPLKKLATEFAEYVLYKKTVFESIDILRNLQEGSVDKLKDLWHKTVNTTIGVDQDIGKFYFSDLANRLKKRLEQPEVLQIFIPELDNSLEDNGFSKAELNLFCASTGLGKSFLLGHITKAAIFQKKKIVYYSLEMSNDKLMARLDASISNVLTREIREEGDKVARSVGKLGKQYGDIVLVKNFPSGLAKVSHLRQHLEYCHRNDFVPEVIIVDYMGLLAPERHTDNRHADLGQTYVDLRGLLQQFDLWGFAAAQSNRAAFHSEITTAADLSETYIGSMTADTIFTLNQTDDEKKKQKMRIYVAKDRNSMDKFIITINTDFSHGNFYKRVLPSENNRQTTKRRR